MQRRICASKDERERERERVKKTQTKNKYNDKFISMHSAHTYTHTNVDGVCSFKHPMLMVSGGEIPFYQHITTINNA